MLPILHLRNVFIFLFYGLLDFQCMQVKLFFGAVKKKSDGHGII